MNPSPPKFWRLKVTMKTRSAVALSLVAFTLAGCSAEAGHENAGLDNGTPDESVGTTRQALTTAVSVSCTTGNVFGNIASVTGTLGVVKHSYPTGFVASGDLFIDTYPSGGVHKHRELQVGGYLDRDGHYANLNPASGVTSDVTVLNLAFGPNTTSRVTTTDGKIYQTNCTTSIISVPRGADLALTATNTMRPYAVGHGRVGVQLDVTNIGNLPATAASGHVRVGTQIIAGSLYQYFGGTATTLHTLNPGENGYIVFTVAENAVKRCSNYNVQIDVDHTMQSGSPSPFDNDTGTVRTSCIRWDQPITTFDLGVQADGAYDGKRLGDIVNSRVIGREDHAKCNACHTVGSSHPYSPGTGEIRPGTLVNGKTWANLADGWGESFLTQTDANKPPYIKVVFRQWIADGAQ